MANLGKCPNCGSIEFNETALTDYVYEFKDGEWEVKSSTICDAGEDMVCVGCGKIIDIEECSKEKGIVLEE